MQKVPNPHYFRPPCQKFLATLEVGKTATQQTGVKLVHDEQSYLQERYHNNTISTNRRVKQPETCACIEAQKSFSCHRTFLYVPPLFHKTAHKDMNPTAQIVLELVTGSTRNRERYSTLSHPLYCYSYIRKLQEGLTSDSNYRPCSQQAPRGCLAKKHLKLDMKM